MPTPEQVAGVFDRAADTYDAVGVPWFTPIARGLVEELGVRPGEQVLDIGCGRGAALLPLAEAVGPTGTALGIDLAPEMVRRTAADMRARPYVEVRLGDACRPDLPAASYDVITSSLVLFFLPDPAAALASWTRLLVAGGRLGVTTFGAQDPHWKAVDAVFTPFLPVGMLDARRSGATGPFSSDEGVSSLFDAVGLVDVRTAHLDVEATFRDVQQLLNFTWSHGQRAMWEAVPAAKHEPVRQQIDDLARQQADAAGRIRFSQQVRYTLGRRLR